jgi:hypothetical protein
MINAGVAMGFALGGIDGRAGVGRCWQDYGDSALN